MKTWKQWIEERRAASNMSSAELPLHEAGPWMVICDEEGRPLRVGRADGRFFSIVASLIANAGREVQQWTQLFLKEATKPGEEGVVVLVTDGAGNYLIQAKADAGNDTEGCILLAPTLQSSRSNLEQAHGGTKPPRAELLEGVKLSWTLLRADGARFWQKRNMFASVVIDPDRVELSANERWFSDEELSEALREGDVNELLSHAWLAALKA